MCQISGGQVGEYECQISRQLIIFISFLSSYTVVLLNSMCSKFRFPSITSLARYDQSIVDQKGSRVLHFNLPQRMESTDCTLLGIYNFCSNISSNRQLINSQDSPTNSLNSSMYQCNRQRLKVFSICQALPRDDKTSYSQENDSPTLEPYSASLQHLTLVSWFSLLRCHRASSVLDTHVWKE